VVAFFGRDRPRSGAAELRAQVLAVPAFFHERRGIIIATFCPVAHVDLPGSAFYLSSIGAI
jgi:hypothetical protein